MKSNDQTLEIEITIDLAKGRRGVSRRKVGSKQPDSPRTPRVTRLMALAIKFQEMVESGQFRDYADLAQLGYVTRARLTQIMNLSLLAPDIQEYLLCLPSGVAVRETNLRAIVGIVDWFEQRHRFEAMVGAIAI